VDIVWQSPEGKELKRIRTELKLSWKNAEEESWISRQYTKLARLGFPIAIIVAIVVIAL
jgi:hypothetical protein